jgi:hypothetical protein
LVRIINIFLILFFINNSVAGQCGNKQRAFDVGEKISYNVYYNLGFMWFNAAEVFFNIEDTLYNKKISYHFISYGNTLPNYNWIYKVNDYYESIVEKKTFKPQYFYKNTKEGGFNVRNKYNIIDTLIYSDINNSKIDGYKDTIKYQQCTFDILTAVYACRSIDFAHLHKNDTIPVKVLIENEIYNLYLHYLGIEDKEDDNENIYRCRMFKVLVVKGTIFTGDEDVSVWISDDKSKTPIYVEAKIIVGSVVAKMRNIKGNRWLLSSKKDKKNNEN